jgi:hypothetical protein
VEPPVIALRLHRTVVIDESGINLDPITQRLY